MRINLKLKGNLINFDLFKHLHLFYLGKNQNVECQKMQKQSIKNFHQCSKTDRGGKFCAKDSLHVPNRFLRLIKESAVRGHSNNT